MAPVVEHLSGKQEALSSTCTDKKEKKIQSISGIYQLYPCPHAYITAVTILFLFWSSYKEQYFNTYT
jgi:hypothetical protein